MLGSGGSSSEGDVMVDTKQRKDFMGSWVFWRLMTAVKKVFRAKWNETSLFSAANPHNQRHFFPQYPTLLLFPTPGGPLAFRSLEIEIPD